MPITDAEILAGLGALPALTPTESAIARAWLNAHAKEFDHVDFNVRLGTGVVLPAGTPEFVQRAARAGTTKRADMILYSATDLVIVEVKIRIGGSALGQLQLYRKLYMSAHPEVNFVHLVAAGQTIEPDVAEIFHENHITVELFPDAGQTP